MIQKIKDNLYALWFFLSTLAIAILYFMYTRRGKSVAALQYEVQKATVAQKFVDLRRQATLSTTEYQNAQDQYDALKRRHPDIVAELGLSGRPPSNH